MVHSLHLCPGQMRVNDFCETIVKLEWGRAVLRE